MTRPLYQIAREIRADMQQQQRGKPSPWNIKWGYAYPYLEAMMQLDKITESYGYDSGKSIVRYFLANASTWKGEKARAIKKELTEMLK